MCTFRKKQRKNRKQQQQMEIDEDLDIESDQDVEFNMDDTGETNESNVNDEENVDKIVEEKKEEILENKIDEIIVNKNNISPVAIVPEIKVEKIVKIDENKNVVESIKLSDITIRISDTIPEKEREEKRTADKIQKKLSSKISNQASQIKNNRISDIKKTRIMSDKKELSKRSDKDSIFPKKRKKLPQIFVVDKNVSKEKSVISEKPRSRHKKQKIKVDNFSEERLLDEPKTIKTKNSEEMIKIKTIFNENKRSISMVKPKLIRKKDLIKWLTDKEEQTQTQKIDMKNLLDKLLRKMNFWPKTENEKTRHTAAELRSVYATTIESKPTIMFKPKQLTPKLSKSIYDNSEQRQRTIPPTIISYLSPPPPPIQETIRVSEASLLPQQLKHKLKKNQWNKQYNNIDDFQISNNWWKYHRMMIAPKKSPKWIPSPLWQKIKSKSSSTKSPKIKIPTRYHSPRQRRYIYK